MPTEKPVRIISDSPKKGDVAFGFDAYAKTIAEVAANRVNETPLVMGIYGPWGSGKTTLMAAVKRFLDGDELFDGDTYRPCKTVWFQAWKYRDEDQILAALIAEIFRSIKADAVFLTQLGGYTEEVLSRLDLPKALGAMLKAFMGFDVNDFMKQPEYRDKLGFYDTFQEFFQRLVWTFTRLRPQFDSQEDPDDRKGALVVFIDDLDRCPQQRIVRVLETVKLFMDKKGCVFIVGAAEDIILKALKTDYGVDARRFMEKIVQVTFTLPRIPDADFRAYLEMIDPESRNLIEPHLDRILRTTRSNPRRFKRFLNDLHIEAGVHRNRKTGVGFDALLAMKLIEFEAPELKKETAGTVHLIKEKIDALSEKNELTGGWEIASEKISAVPAVSLHPYLENRRLVNLMHHTNIDREQVEQIFTINQAVGGEDPMAADVEANMDVAAPAAEFRGRAKTDLDLMVKVDSGPFLYGEDKKQIEIAQFFEIDVYPVTNSQFDRFIRDGGYEKEDLWGEKAWEWRKKNNIIRPKYWEDERWNLPDRPVVGVSFYEADAYAKWAGKRLPTEQEWERAARGNDGRQYPWGDSFDKEKCNTSESGIDRTTRVTRYPTGISPAGCYDMVGNVWEWTDRWYNALKERKVLRGGSWIYAAYYARCVYRNWSNPYTRSLYVGFRCART